MLAVQQYAEFGLEESCGGGETACVQGRDDICLVRSRSRVTGVALEWHQLRYLILEARRPMRESASPKLDASRRPVALYRWILPSHRPGNRVQKTEMSVQDQGAGL